MDQNRLEAFETMLNAVLTEYDRITGQMTQLKSAGKEKTATYRQLMGNKLQYQNMLTLYRLYGLLDAEK